MLYLWPHRPGTSGVVRKTYQGVCCAVWECVDSGPCKLIGKGVVAISIVGDGSFSCSAPYAESNR